MTTSTIVTTNIVKEFKYATSIDNPLIVAVLKDVNQSFKQQKLLGRLVVQYCTEETKNLLFGKKVITTYRVVLKKHNDESEIKLETVEFEAVMAFLQGTLVGLSALEYGKYVVAEPEADRYGEWKIAPQAPDRDLQHKLDQAQDVMNIWSTSSKADPFNVDVLIRSRMNMRKVDGLFHPYTEYMIMGRNRNNPTEIKQLSGRLTFKELGDRLEYIIKNPMKHIEELG